MERKRIVSACCFLLAVSVSCGARAADAPDGALLNTVHVSGRATIEVPPDRVSFTAGVETSATSVAAAVEQNNERVSAVIESLVRAGIDRKRIRTARFTIFPEYDHTQGRQPRIVGYRVHNSVTVDVEQPDTLGRLLQSAIDAGANEVTHVSWSVSEAESTRSRTAGLEAAFEDARSKARVLAARAGRTLGPALIVAEGGMPSPPQPLYAMREMAADASVVPTEAGLHQLVFTVTAVFALD
jgi:uncharacterized protein YggE